MLIVGDLLLQIDVETGSKRAPERSEGLFAYDLCQGYLMPNQSYLVRDPRNGKQNADSRCALRHE